MSGESYFPGYDLLNVNLLDLSSVVDPSSPNVCAADALNYNPLHCLLCSRLLSQPCSLQCRHVFCLACIRSSVRAEGDVGEKKDANFAADCGGLISNNLGVGDVVDDSCLGERGGLSGGVVKKGGPTEGGSSGRANEEVKCPVCGRVTNTSLLPLHPDPLIQFFVDSANEKADVCANCDQVSQPMFFCETCHQALCTNCKDATHQARMFAAHSIIPLEERTGFGMNRLCQTHQEPLILFASDSKVLKCISCFREAPVDSKANFLDLTIAYEQGVEKLETVGKQLKRFQRELRDSILLHQSLLSEVKRTAQTEISGIQSLCQQMVDCLMEVRDHMIQQIQSELRERQEHFRSNLCSLTCLFPTVQLYLLIASIFAASASKLDFLELGHTLMNRINAMIAENQDRTAKFTSQFQTNFRVECAKALDSFLGLNSIYMPSMTRLDPDKTNPRAPNRSNSYSSSDTSPASSIASYYHQVKGARTGAYPSLLRRLMQECVAGTFGEHFSKMDSTMKMLLSQFNGIRTQAQELHRDITLRRCLVVDDRMRQLFSDCDRFDSDLATFSASVDETQPLFKSLWEDQMEKIKQQQDLFQNMVATLFTLRDDSKRVASIARQFEPFIKSIALAVQTIAPKRVIEEEPCPMDRICAQIESIEPDSQSRVNAIEREETQRKAALDAQREADAQEIMMRTKQRLKSTSRGGDGCGASSASGSAKRRSGGILLSGELSTGATMSGVGQIVKEVERERSVAVSVPPSGRSTTPNCSNGNSAGSLASLSNGAPLSPGSLSCSTTTGLGSSGGSVSGSCACQPSQHKCDTDKSCDSVKSIAECESHDNSPASGRSTRPKSYQYHGGSATSLDRSFASSDGGPQNNFECDISAEDAAEKMAAPIIFGPVGRAVDGTNGLVGAGCCPAKARRRQNNLLLMEAHARIENTKIAGVGAGLRRPLLQRSNTVDLSRNPRAKVEEWQMRRTGPAPNDEADCEDLIDSMTSVNIRNENDGRPGEMMSRSLPSNPTVTAEELMSSFCVRELGDNPCADNSGACSLKYSAMLPRRKRSLSRRRHAHDRLVEKQKETKTSRENKLPPVVVQSLEKNALNTNGNKHHVAIEAFNPTSDSDGCAALILETINDKHMTDNRNSCTENSLAQLVELKNEKIEKAASAANVGSFEHKFSSNLASSIPDPPAVPLSIMLPHFIIQPKVLPANAILSNSASSQTCSVSPTEKTCRPRLSTCVLSFTDCANENEIKVDRNLSKCSKEGNDSDKEKHFILSVDQNNLQQHPKSKGDSWIELGTGSLSGGHGVGAPNPFYNPGACASAGQHQAVAKLAATYSASGDPVRLAAFEVPPARSKSPRCFELAAAARKETKEEFDPAVNAGDGNCSFSGHLEHDESSVRNFLANVAGFHGDSSNSDVDVDSCNKRVESPPSAHCGFKSEREVVMKSNKISQLAESCPNKALTNVASVVVRTTTCAPTTSVKYSTPMAAIQRSVEPSTLEARERLLASLIQKVPRIEVGSSNSPERSFAE